MGLHRRWPWGPAAAVSIARTPPSHLYNEAGFGRLGGQSVCSRLVRIVVCLSFLFFCSISQWPRGEASLTSPSPIARTLVAFLVLWYLAFPRRRKVSVRLYALRGRSHVVLSVRLYALRGRSHVGEVDFGFYLIRRCMLHCILQQERSSSTPPDGIGSRCVVTVPGGYLIHQFQGYG